MNSFKHVFFTWLLIQLIYPLVYFLCILMYGDLSEAAIIPFLVVGTAIFSFPALLVAWVSFLLLMEFHMPAAIRFFTWTVIIILLVLSSFWMLPLSEGMNESRQREFLFPLLFASLASLVIRYHQFRHFISNPYSNY